MLKIETSTARYHQPIGTIALVVICLLIGLIALAVGSKAMTPFTLEYDEGLKPLQWFTGPFVQTSIAFLIVDLIFLFGFGMLTEGKMGLAKFLPLFLCIAITGSAIEQFVMKGEPKPAPTSTASGGYESPANIYTGVKYQLKRTPAGKMGILGSVGASTTIFGLLAVCVLCAPSAEYRFGDSESGIPVIGLAGGFVVWEGLKWFLVDFLNGGLPIRLLGLIPGVILGVAFIQLGLARCDGEDLLSGGGSSGSDIDSAAAKAIAKAEQKSERRRKDAEHRRKRKEAIKEKERLVRESKMVELPSAPSIVVDNPVIIEAREAMEAGKSIDAIKLLRDVKKPKHLEQFPLKDYLALFQETAKKGQLQAAAIVLDKSLDGHPNDSDDRRLKYARILLRFKEHQKCQSVLAKVQRKSLSPELLGQYRKLVIQLRQAEAGE